MIEKLLFSDKGFSGYISVFHAKLRVFKLMLKTVNLSVVIRALLFTQILLIGRADAEK